MHFSNSSKLIICAPPFIFVDGNFPADASASNSGENHFASWLLVGESESPPLFNKPRFSTANEFKKLLLIQ